MSRRRTVGVGVLIAWLGGVALAALPTRGAADEAALDPRCAEPGALDATLFLAGDAGAPGLPREPLLEALASEAGERSAALGTDRVAVALLGDNVYPEGLRPAGDAGRAEDERRLAAQLDALRRSGARGYVVPGNHDWSNGGPGGWDAVRRETQLVADRGAREVPPDGCPGPVLETLGARLALVFLDTQWWLHAGPRPDAPGSGCAETREDGAERALAAALRGAEGRHAIVLAHHPLRSGGPHGGKFGWREHVFPLREVDRSLWIPIPVLGSIRHVARMLGVSPQDAASARYRAMIASVERGLAAAPPLVFAAGHDHSLQVIRGGDSARFHVVSGAGSADEVTWAYAIDGTLFAAATPGYARIDAFASGAVEVTIEAVGDDAARWDLFSACLAPAGVPR